MERACLLDDIWGYVGIEGSIDHSDWHFSSNLHFISFSFPD